MSNGNQIIKFDSISDVHDFLGIDKPKHPLVSVLPLTKCLSDYENGDVTYVFGFYQVTLKSGIKGSIVYGRNNYDFQEGTMIFSKPGQALQYKQTTYERSIDGWGLIFHPDLIRKSKLANTIDSYSFFSYDLHEALHVSVDERKSLTDLTQKIVQEYQNNIDRHTQKLMIANIELVLDYCTRYYDRQFYMRANLNQGILAKFENLLIAYYSSMMPREQGVPTVKYCGDKLNMSAHYLSDLLKKETGNSAQQHIHQFLINRAKTQLLNSSEQIAQIAYGLGFEYPQHFSKLFKSKTGMSPVEYRSRH